jgi:hypothetical protein
MSSERFSGAGWDDLLDQACRRSGSESGSPFSMRRSLSALPDGEREELDLYLSRTLKEDESEAMADCLAQLEETLSDRPQALELLEHIRQDVARTALRCIEQGYLYGKRRGQRDALDMLLPYIRDLSPAP